MILSGFNIQIPTTVRSAMTALKKQGYQVYVVGGAVRDCVLGKEPHDWDLATNAEPELVKECFSKTIDTGLKHGTVTAVIDESLIEITTFRTEGKYSDGRHPDYVRFVGDIKDDLFRRDFTINAMAIDYQGRIVDPYGGLTDIEAKRIRCVGNPHDRFREDALRMLRALRFESTLGFSLDDSVKAAIKQDLSLLSATVSKERVREELCKMIKAPKASTGYKDAAELGVLSEIHPILGRLSSNSPCLKYLDEAPEDLQIRWAILLQELCFAYSAKDVLACLRFSYEDMHGVCEYIKYCDCVDMSLKEARRFAADHNKDFLRGLAVTQRAHGLVTTPGYCSQAVAKAWAAIKDHTAIKMKDLLIDGNDLIQMGYQGKEVGDMLKDLYDDCLEEPSHNEREYLLSVAEACRKRPAEPDRTL